MAFENGIVPEDWRSAVIVPLYKGIRERTECKNYRAISLSVVGNIYLSRLSSYSDYGFDWSREVVCRLDLHTKADR